jgi:hypothetical protein
VALGCAVGTVRSRLHRGRALLAEKLAAEADLLIGQDGHARAIRIGRPTDREGFSPERRPQ